MAHQAGHGPSIKDLDAEALRRRQILGEGVPEQMSQEDISWALNHLMGYGQVDAPSPFGHNRDVFMAEHPGYAGPYYNPASGSYDAPTEAPFSTPEPQRGSTGEGLPTYDMGGLPTGGNSEASDPQVQNSVSQAADMPGAQPQEPSTDAGLTFGQLLDMLSTYTENSQTSSGT